MNFIKTVLSRGDELHNCKWNQTNCFSRSTHTVQPGAAFKSGSRAKPSGRRMASSELPLAFSTCRSSKGPSTWEAKQEVVNSVSAHTCQLGAWSRSPHHPTPWLPLHLPRRLLRGLSRFVYAEHLAQCLGHSESCVCINHYCCCNSSYHCGQTLHLLQRTPSFKNLTYHLVAVKLPPYSTHYLF